ncbi:type IX secretion system periplasmic lipoprotein PorW/SprE [Ornithobacterium rhinotracheale]|uniref:type IX secretion system periplasmic lipoprotein PorW/SprE n=1 Tax=Ornithobacterium rhinotracheale TaxID=28251 RepID=UPI0040371EE3
MLKRIICLISIILVFGACSTRKDSFKNRTYHKATAWFNTLFNGQQAINERLKEAKISHQDNYFEVLKVSPYGEFSSDENAEQVDHIPGRGIGLMGGVGTGNVSGKENNTSTGYAKAEEKALKAIDNHSMIIKGEERNKEIARAYLMLGQARYYQGKTFPALEAFEHVKRMGFKKFIPWAEYYSALAQIQGGNNYAAAKILDELYATKDLKKPLKALVAQQYAELFYQAKNYESSINALSEAIKNTRNKKQKARLYFVQGQILSEIKDYKLANEKFSKVYKLKPGFEMEARAIVAKAMNFQPKEDNANDFVSALKKYAGVGNYEKYKNEFLYAIGNIEEKIDSINLAKKYYLLALKDPMSSPQYRAETFAALGNIYMRKAEYVYANAYYDSAVAVIPQSRRKEELAELSKNLNQVMQMHYLVVKNDSIINISSLNPVEQKEFFKHFISNLKKKDEEQRQQDEKMATEFKTQRKIKSFDSSFGKGGSKFYFYSESAKTTGENEFKRLWGNITLRDNWRNSATGGNVLAEKKAELIGQTDAKNPRRYELEYYLEQIPTPAQLNTLKLERDTTQLKLGVAYADLLKNSKWASETLELLLSSPPKKDSVKYEAYFQLYRINRKNNVLLSDKYKNLILSQYPNSLYAQYIKNPAMDLDKSNSEEALVEYKKAYELFEEKDYKQTIKACEKGIVDFETEPLVAKFSLLKALAYYRMEDKESYLAELNRIVTRYKDSLEAERARKLLDLANPNKKEQLKDKPTEHKKEEEQKMEQKKERQMRQGISIFG